MGRGIEQSGGRGDSMTQKERQERSRKEIFQAALEEFGKEGYEKVTMERICSNHAISKGMMYHYYSNKDELFLLCVQKTFEALKSHIEQNIGELLSQDAFDAMKNYFLIREQFFELNPQYKLVFEIAVIYPPRHLSGQIKELHQPIMDMNWHFLESAVARMSLRPDINPEKVTRYLQSIEPVLRSIASRYQPEEALQDLHSMLEAVQEILDMVLFGILKQPGITLDGQKS